MQNPKSIKPFPKPDSDLIVKLARALSPDDPIIIGWANDSIQKDPVYLKYQKPVESKRKQRKRKGR